jgi:hypothetical protein
MKYLKLLCVEPIYWLISSFMEYKRAKRYNPEVKQAQQKGSDP